MKNKVNVYVGNFGTYEIPEDLYQKAIDINNGKSIIDKRTKGARLINYWGINQDATIETSIMIRDNLLDNVSD